jgi:phage tail-like protein
MKKQDIERLMPLVFRRTASPGSPLDALLEVMQALHEPAEAELGRFASALAPLRAPDAFVPYLAGWVDLDRFFEETPVAPRAGSAVRSPWPTGLGRLRELIAAAAWLSQWRGTSKGLVRFLETATGCSGFVVEEEVADPGQPPRPFHIRVRAPASTRPVETLLHRIIRSERPAYVTYELAFE